MDNFKEGKHSKYHVRYQKNKQNKVIDQINSLLASKICTSQGIKWAINSLLH